MPEFDELSNLNDYKIAQSEKENLLNNIIQIVY